MVDRRVGSVARAVLPRPRFSALIPPLAAVTNNTNLVAENSTDVFSYGSGGQKSTVSLTGLKSSPPPSYKDPREYIGPTWIMQDNLLISGSLITPAKSLTR